MKEKYEKYLPIGSVVLLKDALKKVMIVGYAVSSMGDDEIYDYLGCLWPEGVMSTDHNLLFNHDSIEKIIAIGYSNEETKTFMGLMKRALEFRKMEIEEQQQNNNKDNSQNEE